MPPTADHPDDHTLEDLLCEALDTAAADPIRLHLMLRIYMMTHDLDRATAHVLGMHSGHENTPARP